MSDNLIPISFALTPRMQSFVEMRDALRCMSQAIQQGSPYAWLPAIKDVHDLLIGEGNKKPAIPNIISLFNAMQKHFKDLSRKYPEFDDKLSKASLEVEGHASNIRKCAPKVASYLSSDAWVTAYTDTIRKQDLLGHKLALPQLIYPLWQNSNHASKLYQQLEPIMQAIEHLNEMLHSHVPWEKRIATNGYDQITLASQDAIGLIIIGVPQSAVQQGVIPSCSGFRAVIRLRFSQWKAGEVEQDIQHNQDYALMAVPIS